MKRLGVAAVAPGDLIQCAYSDRIGLVLRVHYDVLSILWNETGEPKWVDLRYVRKIMGS